MLDAEGARAGIASCIAGFCRRYREGLGLATDWGRPLVGFADAGGACVRDLRRVVSPTHHLPQEFLPGATVVVCYFLPFAPAVERANRGGEEPSAVWVDAYNDTNRMFPVINDEVARLVEGWGYHAASPRDTGFTGDGRILSNWSQRHLAFAAGLGTFGLNNMLITEAGTCGRLFSLVSDLPVAPDAPLAEERCLHKRDGSCGLCVGRCPIGALGERGTFDRRACYDRLNGFDRRLGADVCGKCVVGLPCTFRDPSAPRPADGARCPGTP